MKIVNKVLMIVLGLIMVIFGANKLFSFFDMPPPEEGSVAANFFALLGGSYLLKLLGITEVIGGFTLLVNRYAALGLVLLAPVTVNILVYHLTIDLAGGLMGYVVFGINAYLLFLNKDKYSGMLSA